MWIEGSQRPWQGGGAQSETSKSGAKAKLVSLTNLLNLLLLLYKKLNLLVRGQVFLLANFHTFPGLQVSQKALGLLVFVQMVFTPKPKRINKFG